MSVDMQNCHSWPLDVSNNLSEYFMSSSVHMHFAFGYHEQHWTVKSWLCPLAFFYRQEGGGLSARPPPPPWMGHFWASYSSLVWYGMPVHVAVKLICLTIGLWIFLRKDNVLLLLQYDMGGSICLWCLYLYICTGISWYFLIEQWRDYSVLWQCWLGGSIYLWVSMTPMNSEEITLCSGSVDLGEGGSICPWYLHVFSMHWYFLISWLFRMGSHWWHWKVYSSLSALAVSKGGPSAFGIYMFSLCTGISLYFLISWLFEMGSHWQHWKV